ncbi:hypothetical protein UAW_02920 [Enterococcus haemoperoxidus ATCC BAA-382]|uniref:Lipoprotein n=1 Tax=Enterococcus haemoperoxidus ATCC BAA-382 TaxID=1158608 RepID=R2SY08_9ENTE|nr:hypothetical protein [Enterococcus haemoperoxidus]EOH92879.1 hypothetical protein UAW_02920 [Enterococcus haemoperoxidus ATCC BAA-382]EOT61622.1 hypothetical protein I583_00604 [Enterococcus haemoperoxidus ATCC BAA-382]OJG55455.1 hypothetical protein RV06_GL001898 [Enterococcus haemoperoxidus]
MKKQHLLASVLLFTVVSLTACKPDQQKGTKKTSETSKEALFIPSSSEVDASSEEGKEKSANDLSFENTSYNYDVVTGATQTTFGSNPKPLYSYEEKLKKMFWSNQPPLGLMEGNYYTNEGYFDVGNKGIVEIITDDTSKIINVEFNEYAAENYYASNYSGANKRLSDYAFFQAQNPRTDTTLVTVVNGITFVEKQMREENRIEGNFETVKGSSTTARQGLMAIASELKDQIRQPSKTKYIGYAEDFGDGLIGRLQLTVTDGKIDSARYDEYFADQPEKIAVDQLKQYYRQSKYFSLTYNEQTNKDFVIFSDTLTKEIIDKQKLTIENTELTKHPSYASYQKLVEHIKL